MRKEMAVHVSFDELVRRARAVARGRRLSEVAEAGGVGAALLTEAGRVYCGVSIDTACSMGFCAEHAAAAAMVTAGESRVVRMVAVGADGAIFPPCGRCREFIWQLDERNASAEVLVGQGRIATLRELLPHAWCLGGERGGVGEGDAKGEQAERDERAERADQAEQVEERASGGATGMLSRERAGRASDGELGGVTVRRLDEADAAAFQALRLEGLVESPTAFASSYEEESGLALGVVAERLRAAPDRAMFGAFVGDALVGVFGIAREEQRKLRHRACIWGVYVTSAARQRGVGRRLIEQAIEHASAMPGLRQVNLSVNAANAPAIALYEAAGFEAFGLERGYLLVDGTLHDELHMARGVGPGADERGA